MYQHPWFVAGSIRYCQRVPEASLKSGPGKHSIALAVLLVAIVNRPATKQRNTAEGIVFSGIVSLVPKRAAPRQPKEKRHRVPPIRWKSARGPDAESALFPLYVGTPAVVSHLINNILRCREKCTESSPDANVVRHWRNKFPCRSDAQATRGMLIRPSEHRPLNLLSQINTLPCRPRWM